MANEKRQIKLRKRLIYAGDLWQKTFDCEEPGDFRKAIENAPTVDAVEVVHGRWKLIEDCWAIYQCSCCKEEFVTEDGEEVDELWNYCPNCGAKMDGDTNGNL